MSDTDLSPANVDRRFKNTWEAPKGIGHWFAVVNNQELGRRYMLTAFIFFLVAGVLAELMRTQLIVPENTFLTPETYNRFMTMHGSIMMYLFIIPFVEGAALFLIPLMIGARDVAFPRLTAFGYWTYLFGSLIFFSSFFLSAVPDMGWFAYPPLAGPEFSLRLPMSLWLVGLTLTEVSATLAGAELAVTILKMRAPGMRISQMPLFAWAILVFSFMLVFAFPVLAIASILLQLDFSWGTRIFDPDEGGSPLLWQHLFWIFGHPEVYIQFLPATGIISTIIPTFARRPIAFYRLVVLALVTTGYASFGLWVHHMYTVGFSSLELSFFNVASFAIAIAAGAQVFAWIATLWMGRVQLRPPMLFALGAIFTFVAGGITGVMVAAVPFDWQAHDSYFVVAHFHYVLIGGSVFPLFAGLYYWLPKVTGRMLGERLGAWNFWLVFLGFHLTFFPMHLSGLRGMPRRVYTYQEGLGLDALNLMSTLGAYTLGVGILLFVVNFVRSLYVGREPGYDPWRAGTLEWSVSSPPPVYNLHAPPIVHTADPLWDQERLDRGDERAERAVRALEGDPYGWRATLTTSLVEAEPQAIHYLHGPSYAPFAAALGLLIGSIGTIAQVYILAVIGGLAAVGAFTAWLWPREREWKDIPQDDVVDRAGLAVAVTGSRSIGWWGVLLGITALAVVVITLAFSYLYVAVRSEVWPQGAIALPDIPLPLAALGLLVLSVAPMLWSVRSMARGRADRALLGLAASFVLGGGTFALELYRLVGYGFLPQENAYASLVYVIGIAALVLIATGLALNTGTQLRVALGHFGPDSFVALQNVANLWYFVVASGAALVVVTVVVPHLLS